MSVGSAVAALVSAELAQPVDPRVVEMAAAVAAQHGAAARAVLFYGSCLREAQLDGLMLDFYLIVSDYRAAYERRWLAHANRLIPPNVFPFAYKGLSAKYAVLSEMDFARLCGVQADNVSVWARFAQPARLVWAADDAARASAVSAVAQAGPTLLGLALPGVAAERRGDARAVFDFGFSMTYKAELRAERKGRGGSIIDSAPDYYDALFDAAKADGLINPAAPVNAREMAAAERLWRRLQRRGKWLSVIRLIKASFTFAGGIDYLAWKINRHAGTQIVIRPWQRRHPLIAAIMLLPRLMASRAVG
ncbi:hypothetical protein OOT33_01710 [Sphingobium sp. DEHP117]|uniref:hypothetical protein n=1 Tax=Sphingobium sp. DEHP117 TaxID=2993436 RepID=UPI0027D6238B|nr:hypothetical protein [Sphingobium sp. DEHP117]MDQ4419158.1 hypothetical protein [Sphingobium sp. DEHP117]